jgi:hypothetical protein
MRWTSLIGDFATGHFNGRTHPIDSFSLKAMTRHWLGFCFLSKNRDRWGLSRELEVPEKPSCSKSCNDALNA